jgi:hypothetical protein
MVMDTARVKATAMDPAVAIGAVVVAMDGAIRDRSCTMRTTSGTSSRTRMTMKTGRKIIMGLRRRSAPVLGMRGWIRGRSWWGLRCSDYEDVGTSLANRSDHRLAG